jgi:hypothetical protein
MKCTHNKIALPAALFLAATFAGPAQAAFIETTLTISNNQNWQPQPGEFATVRIEDVGDDIMFTITLLNQPATENRNIEQFGFTGTGLDLSTAVFDFTGMTPTWSYGGSATLDGFGNFQDTVQFNGPGGAGDDPLIFTIELAGDTINDYVTTGSTGGQPNAGGLFSAKVSSTGPGAFIGMGDQYVVPVPAAVWLFGSGLVGLVGIARRKKTA